MIFRRTFQLPSLDATAEQRIVEFWRRRGVRLRKRRGRTWIGRRGRLWGVLGSDYTRWPTRVRVRVHASGALECSLRIGTRIATFTEETRPLPDAEIQAFGAFVAGQDYQLEGLNSGSGARPWWVHGLLAMRPGALRAPRRIRASAGMAEIAVRAGSCLTVLLIALMAYIASIEWQLYLSRYSKPFRWWDDCILPILVLTGVLGVLAASSAFLVWQRRRSRRCLSAEQVAAQFGTSPEEAQRSLAERGVKPRFIVDGLPVYDPAHVTDAGTLLRPADPPAGETLLRAAAPAVQADAATLLRPAMGEAGSVSAEQPEDEAIVQEARR